MDYFKGLRPHQPAHVQNILRALLYGSVALDASDTGVGKTYCALATARILGVPAVVIGPKGVKSEWEAAGAIMGVPVEFWSYDRARGRPTKINWFNPEVFGPSFKSRSESELGYEQPHGSGSFWQWKRRFAFLIFDEAHRCGGGKTLNGKLLRSCKKAADYILAMSATLADDILQLKNIGLAMGLFTNKTYMGWLFKHGGTTGIFGAFEADQDPEVQRAGMLKLHKEIFPKRGARLRRKDIPGFPNTQIDLQLVDNPDAIKWAKQAAEAYEVYNLQAYAESAQMLEKLLIDPIIERVEDVVSDTCKVVIFTNYVATIDTLKMRLEKKGFSVVTIDGRQVGEKGDRDRKNAKESFQQNLVDVALVNAAAGAAGLSLHDPTGVVERETEIMPIPSGRQVKQVFGRVQRDGGAFSRQYLWHFKNTQQEKTLLTSIDRMRNIDALNDGDLDSLKLI